MNDNQLDVIVIGGGLAGLAAAATAQRAGARTVVLEARRPGGRARTTVRDGYTLNLGAHALYAGGPGAAVLRRLGVRPDGARPPLRSFRIEIDGELHLFPGTPATFFRSTGLGARAKGQLAKVLASVARVDCEALAGESTETWLRHLDLLPDAERVLRVMLRTSTYSADFDVLSAGAAVSQLRIAAGPGVRYLHDGWGPMVGALARQVEVRHCKVHAVEPSTGGIHVETDNGTLVAASVVVATGDPAAIRSVLPADPAWPSLGRPVTVACLDVAVRGIPSPGYVMGTNDDVFATMQGPPARQAPEGGAVVGVTKYDAEEATSDRELLERYLRLAGVQDDAVAFRRFLPCMLVTGPPPAAAVGGLRGRPSVDASGCDGVYIAGDWIGPDGLLADAALASGEAAARRAVGDRRRSATMAS